MSLDGRFWRYEGRRHSVFFMFVVPLLHVCTLYSVILAVLILLLFLPPPSSLGLHRTIVELEAFKTDSLKSFFLSYLLCLWTGVFRDTRDVNIYSWYRLFMCFSMFVVHLRVLSSPVAYTITGQPTPVLVKVFRPSIFLL